MNSITATTDLTPMTKHEIYALESKLMDTMLQILDSEPNGLFLIERTKELALGRITFEERFGRIS